MLVAHSHSCGYGTPRDGSALPPMALRGARALASLGAGWVAAEATRSAEE